MRKATPLAPATGQYEVAWHMLSAQETAARLGTDLQRGLSDEQAAERRARFGPNELERGRGPSAVGMFLRQLTEPLMLLLIAAAIISGAVTREATDAAVIGVIVLLSALLGFTQERRAHRALEALRALAQPVARVLRNGQPQEIPAVEVVPGEVLLVEAGMRIAADARVVEEASLEADEAALTGEAYPVDKTTAVIPDAQAPLGDRKNMLYSGTVITRGRGKAVVVATGMDTELGKIAALLEETGETATPLQRRLHGVGKVLMAVAVAICGVVLVVGLLRQHTLEEMFLTAVSLAVAAVPEGLPAVITIALALGAQQMVRRRALIRRLPAVEGLGSVTVICTDKTGTLTEGAMRPVLLWTPEGEWRLEAGGGRREAGEGTPTVQTAGGDLAPALKELLRAFVLCNDAHLPVGEDGAPDYGRALGDPTEVALLAAGLAAGLRREDLAEKYPRLDEIPFDSDRKRMTTVHPHPAGEATPYFAVVKGAPDQVLERCTRYRRDGEVWPLDSEARAEVAAHIRESSAEGLRLLAAAYAPLPEIPEDLDPEVVERDLVFLGLIALMDPPRPEAAPAVAVARQAGIRTVMVTGDYAATAASIAEQVGLLEEGGRVMEGKQLETLSVEELAEQAPEIAVYARVSPADKVKVVEAWRKRGEIVAVTGDGVNDAAALQRAEIGTAMGKVGTEVAKDASDMVLLDDNFATIVAAIEQGRVIYDNIRKFIRYLLGTNTGEIWTIFFAIVLGWPLPLLPVQILWVNLVTDGLPALALGFEPAEGDVMRRRPRSPRESLFARGMGLNILWTGLLMGLITLALFFWDWARTGYPKDPTDARTLAFFTLAGLQMANVLSVRMERALVLGRNFFTNPRLLAAVALTLLGQLAVTYVPALQGIFRTSALTGAEIGLSLAACVGFFLVAEAVKWAQTRADRSRESEVESRE